MPQKGWIQAIQLRAGDRLQLLNGEYVIIEQIQHEILEDPVFVYNFEVEEYHTYYVGEQSVFVHNRCNGNWSKGSYASPEESAREHFIKHRNEVGAHSVQQYTNKATSFANTVLAKRVARTFVDGATKNVYRYSHGGRYVDLVFDGVEHLIVSFGAV